MFRPLQNLLLAMALTVAAITPAFAGSTAANPPPANAYVLQVNGLACPFCAYGIEKEFAKQSGVENTNVNLKRGMLVVTVKPGTTFSDARLAQLVKEAGFQLKAVVSRPTTTAASTKP